VLESNSIHNRSFRKRITCDLAAADRLRPTDSHLTDCVLHSVRGHLCDCPAAATYSHKSINQGVILIWRAFATL